MRVNPEFCVVIFFHGRVSRVTALLNDLDQQSCRDFEVILVDDGTPGDIEFPSTLASGDVTVRLIRLPERSGAPVARNTGAAASASRYLAFLDSDDFFDPDKLMYVQKALGKEDDCALIYAPFNIADEYRKVTRTVKPGPTSRLQDALTLGIAIGGCSAPIVSRKAFEEIGGFDETLPSCQDWDLWVRISEGRKCLRLDEVLTEIEWGSAASGADRITKSTLARLQGHRHFFKKHGYSRRCSDEKKRQTYLRLMGRVLYEGQSYYRASLFLREFLRDVHERSAYQEIIMLTGCVFRFDALAAAINVKRKSVSMVPW